MRHGGLVAYFITIQVLSNVLLLSRVTSLPRAPPLALALLSRVHSEVVSGVAYGVVMHDDTRSLFVVPLNDLSYY